MRGNAAPALGDPVISEPPVLYRDDRMLVIDKPSALAVHRGWANERDTALRRARALAGVHVHPVHRLDRATSGVLVFALDVEALRQLSRSFEARNVQKLYLALVRGEPDAEGLIDHPVLRGESGERVEAQTRFVKLGRSPVERSSLLRVEPLTGRLHQIRRHLKHISHPIVGDVRYGKGDINRHYRERYGIHRLVLHAHRLSVPHPEHGRRIELCAPLPSELRELFERLELGSALE